MYIFVIRNDRPAPITQTTVDLSGTSFEQLDLPENYDIRQFEGVTLRFIVENNRHANNPAQQKSGVPRIDWDQYQDHRS